MIGVVRINPGSDRYKLWMDAFGSETVPVSSIIPYPTNIKGGPAYDECMKTGNAPSSEFEFNREDVALSSTLKNVYKVDMFAMRQDDRSRLLGFVAKYLQKQEHEISWIVWGSHGVDIMDGTDLTVYYESEFAF